MKSDPILDEVGKLFVSNFVDKPLDTFHSQVAGKGRAPDLQAYRRALGQLDSRTIKLMEHAIRESLVQGIHDFLFALKQRTEFENDIHLLVNGKNIVDLSDGIHGELFTEDGWLSRFSKYGDISQPYTDD